MVDVLKMLNHLLVIFDQKNILYQIQIVGKDRDMLNDDEIIDLLNINHHQIENNINEINFDQLMLNY
jgi:hypothetical protein